MVPTVPEDIVQHDPTEQIQFVIRGALEEADLVCVFLRVAGFVPGEPTGLTQNLLLDLGGMVRLRAWEVAGFDEHLKAGLPTAHEARSQIIDIIQRAVTDPTQLARAGALGRAVFDLRVSQFAWVASMEFQADIALCIPDEDTLIEALADLLWASRLPQKTV